MLKQHHRTFAFNFRVDRAPTTADITVAQQAAARLAVWVHKNWGRQRLSAILGVPRRTVDAWFSTRRIPPRYAVAIDMLNNSREEGIRLNELWPEVEAWPVGEACMEFRPDVPYSALRTEYANIARSNPEKYPHIDDATFMSLYWTPPKRGTYNALTVQRAADAVALAMLPGGTGLKSLDRTTLWLATKPFSAAKARQQMLEEQRQEKERNVCTQSYDELLDEEERASIVEQARQDRVSTENAEFDRQRDQAARLSGGTGHGRAPTMPEKAPVSAYTHDKSGMNSEVAALDPSTPEGLAAWFMREWELSEEEAWVEVRAQMAEKALAGADSLAGGTTLPDA